MADLTQVSDPRAMSTRPVARGRMIPRVSFVEQSVLVPNPGFSYTPGQPSSHREVRMCLIGLVLALSLVFAPVAADAQQGGRIYRIGVLLAASPSTSAPNLDAFREGLRELGHVEGQ